MKFPLILASTSVYRKSLLEKLGYPFRGIPPLVDENIMKGQGKSPREIAEALAKLKAMAVFKKHPQALVIGSDQVVSCEEKILGKGGSFEAAFEQLQFISGKTHQLITSVCLIYPGGLEEFTEIVTLSMPEHSDEFLQAYLKKDAPYDCAGSYKIEENGMRLFNEIKCEDHSAIIGLPLLKTHKALRRLLF